jgi:hypothetical protein
VNEEQFENYLREFEPKKPRALSELAAPLNWRRLAAAIAIFFLGATSLWNVFHHQNRKKVDTKVFVEQMPVPASTISLTKLAVENPSDFEATLDARALKTLQRFDRADSSLRALARE